MGDGELNEGQVWEAVMFANHYKLKNLTAIIDRNCMQASGWTEDIIDLGFLANKFSAFGWESCSCNGHLLHMINEKLNHQSLHPYALIANTIKGNGFSFTKMNADWHTGKLSKSDYDKAMSELEGGELNAISY